MAFSATGSAFEGLHIAKRHPGAILGWAFFYAIAMAVVFGIVIAMVGATVLVGVFHSREQVAEDPGAIIGALSGLGAGLIVFMVACMFIGAVQITAVYRAVLRPEERGFCFLKLGADEFRQVVLMLVFSLFTILFWGVLAGAGVYAYHELGLADGAMVAAAFAAGLLGLILTIYVGVRLSMAQPMTFAQRRIRIFGSWSLTRGKFWPLLGMYVLMIVFAIIVSLVFDGLATALAAAGGWSLSSMNFEDGAQFEFAALSATALAAAAGWLVLTFISLALQLAVAYGPQAAAYRGLIEERSPPPPAAEETPGPVDPIVPAAAAGAAVAAAGPEPASPSAEAATPEPATTSEPSPIAAFSHDVPSAPAPEAPTEPAALAQPSPDAPVTLEPAPEAPPAEQGPEPAPWTEPVPAPPADSEATTTTPLPGPQKDA